MNKKAEQYNSDIIGNILSEITPKELKRIENKMLLAAKIKRSMDAKNWRKKHLAEALQQKPSVITKWLSGTHNFTSDTLSDIEEVLGVTLLALEEKKEIQVIHYHLQVTSTYINTSPDCNSRSPKNTNSSVLNIRDRKKQDSIAVC